MNKTAIKTFAIWARNKLIDDITYKAGLLGITDKEIKTPLPQSTLAVQFFDIGTKEPYAITGNEAWSYADIAAALSRLTGRNLRYQDITEEALRDALRAVGAPEFPIWLTLGTLHDIKSGQYEIQSRDLETLLGRAPKSLDAMLRSVFGLSS